MKPRSNAGRPIVAMSVLSVVVIGVAAAGAYVVRGDRYRLYTDPRAGHCWQALEALALSSSSLRPVRVDVGASDKGDEISVDIEYRMDRVLGGATLDASCIYPSRDETPPRARAIELAGTALDAETLGSINDLTR